MQDTAIRDRVARARRLVEEGRVTRHGDLHVVHGRGGNYTINLDGQTCSCKAGRKGMACYHVQAVEQFEACRRKKKPKTNRRHKPKAESDGLRGIGQQIGPDRMQANVDRLNV
jgi:hypothetical protein